jgi:hypothetical protein
MCDPCLRLMRLMVLTTLRLRQRSYQSVFAAFITRFPGERWARTKEMAEHHRMPNLATTE